MIAVPSRPVAGLSRVVVFTRLVAGLTRLVAGLSRVVVFTRLFGGLSRVVADSKISVGTRSRIRHLLPTATLIDGHGGQQPTPTSPDTPTVTKTVPAARR